jgi:hypothetical protein
MVFARLIGHNLDKSGGGLRSACYPALDDRSHWRRRSNHLFLPG